MKNLPDNLYNVDSIVQLEQIAINQFGIPAYTLMKSAGEAVFNVIQTKYPLCKNVLVLCGAGNNAGDGYVVARLAKQAGFNVRVVSLIDPLTLKNDALHAYQDWLSVGESDVADKSLLNEADIIVDAPGLRARFQVSGHNGLRRLMIRSPRSLQLIFPPV